MNGGWPWLGIVGALQGVDNNRSCRIDPEVVTTWIGRVVTHRAREVRDVSHSNRGRQGYACEALKCSAVIMTITTVYVMVGEVIALLQLATEFVTTSKNQYQSTSIFLFLRDYNSVRRKTILRIF